MQKLTLWQELYKYRWLLEQLIARDLKNKYRKSVLGYLWSVLSPLLMMTVMTIVFSTLFRYQIKNFPVYLLLGQLVFSFFSESSNMGMSAILNNGALIKKIYLPKYIFPLSRILSSFTTTIFSLVALLLVMIITRTQVHFTVLLVPVVLFYLLLFCIGIGILLSALMVRFRDLMYLWGVFLTALNYLSAIFYPVSILPNYLKKIMLFNPIFDYINMFRKVVLYGQWPSVEEHLICIGFAVGALLLGSIVFKQRQKDFILYI